MNHYDWVAPFQACYEKAIEQYRQGNRSAPACFNAEQAAFLARIGCSAQEVYDFAEDFVTYGEPSFGTALLITAVRRDYFLVVQNGRPTGRVIRMEELPAKDAELAGFKWLPRLISKARAKLRGEMPAELMYGCGGDRAFLKRVDIHPADFLRAVWWAHDDDEKIIGYVRQHADGLDNPRAKRV